MYYAKLMLLLFGAALSPEKDSSKEYLYKDENEISGFLSGYNEGVMQVSIDYYDTLNYFTWCGFECRNEADLDGFIVVAHCQRIGSLATLHVDRSIYNVLVVDCIAQKHIVSGNIFDNGYIAELNFDLFQQVYRRFGTIRYK